MRAEERVALGLLAMVLRRAREGCADQRAMVQGV